MRTCGQRLALVKTAAGGQPTLGTSAPMFMRWTRRREDFCGRRTWKSFPAQRLRERPRWLRGDSMFPFFRWKKWAGRDAHRLSCSEWPRFWLWLIADSGGPGPWAPRPGCGAEIGNRLRFGSGQAGRTALAAARGPRRVDGRRAVGLGY